MINYLTLSPRLKCFCLIFLMSCYYTLTGSAQENNFAYYTFKDKNGKWGYHTLGDKVMIKPKFDDAQDFYRRIAGVKKDGKWGFIDQKGKVIIPFQFDEVQYLNVKKDGKWGRIDREGNLVTDYQYSYLAMSGQWAVVSRDNKKFGYIDSAGKEAIPLIYDDAKKFDNGNTIIKTKDGQYKMLTFAEMAPVKVDSCWGYINKKGQMSVPPIYKVAQQFSNGLAWVSVDGINFGAINKKNTVYIPFYITKADPFENGASYVTYSSNNGVISAGGLFRSGNGSWSRQLSGPLNVDNGNGDFQRGFDAFDAGDDKKAIAFFEKAYQGGYIGAARNIALVYSAAEATPDNIKQALHWFYVAGERGDVVALITQAEYYMAGKNFPKDKAKAFEMYRRAAAWLSFDYYWEEDDETLETVIDGLISLAECYEYGEGTTRNYEQAKYWYEYTVDYDDYSLVRLADMYYNADGANKDLKSALTYYLSATGGYPQAAYMAGMMYLKGEGTSKNESQAKRLLTLAAQKGDKNAIAQLGKMGIKY